MKQNKSIRIGRDFTNLLNTHFLTEQERQHLKEGKLLVSDMDAKVQLKTKTDIVNQIRVAKETGISHVELDGGVPNPFLDITPEYCEEVRGFAGKNDVTLSFHIPYTFVATATAAFQDADREIAVGLIKRYVDVAEKINCNNVVMHPGAVPFYQTTGEYGRMIIRSVIKSFSELAVYAREKKLVLHLENNTAFDCVAFEIQECLEIIEEVNKKGNDLKFCFDIGHWFTRADAGKKIPEPPESIMDSIPAGVLGQVHLNDYIPVVKKFHPPLHFESGLLKRGNLVNLMKKFKDKGVSLVIVETAVRDVNDLLNSIKIIEDEQKYLKGIIDEVEKDG